MSGIEVTGQPGIDEATAEIAVALRDAHPEGFSEQWYYDEAERLRNAILRGARRALEPVPWTLGVNGRDWFAVRDSMTLEGNAAAGLTEVGKRYDMKLDGTQRVFRSRIRAQARVDELNSGLISLMVRVREAAE
jgi:hypothetical protein